MIYWVRIVTDEKDPISRILNLTRNSTLGKRYMHLTRLPSARQKEIGTLVKHSSKKTLEESKHGLRLSNTILTIGTTEHMPANTQQTTSLTRGRSTMSLGDQISEILNPPSPVWSARVV